MAKSSGSYRPGHAVPTEVQKKASNRGWEATKAKYGNPIFAPGAVEKAKKSNSKWFEALRAEKFATLRAERRKVHDVAVSNRIVEIQNLGGKMVFSDRKGSLRPDLIYVLGRKVVAEDIKTGKDPRIEVDFEVTVP